MPELAAFVGHSFAEADKPVVEKVLKMLDGVAALMNGFEWDHALAAEPKVLSEKVREKMRDKNLFIGICTAREDVIDSQRWRSPWWLGQNSILANRSSIARKTSDWIIQEIGLAIGRDMDLILLIEEGVRLPGGLQGDLEYIPFNRNEPERCLEKLVSMLRALSPKVISLSVAKEQEQSAEQKPPVNEDDFLKVHFTPTAMWAADTFVARYQTAITWKLEEEQRSIEEAFENSAFAKDEAAKISFLSAGIAARAEALQQRWIEPLNELIKKHPNQPGPHIGLAHRFAASGDPALAAEHLVIASNLSTDKGKALTLRAQAALHLVKAKDLAGAEILASECGRLIRKNPDLETQGMAVLANVWKEIGNDAMFMACAERCLELAPDRATPRFDLAYKYSALGMEAHALFHYQQYVAAADKSGGWNNLGVSAAQLNLPITAIDAYKRADKEGNSLATSNIAFAQLEAGFLEEALSVCQDGIKKPEPDPRLAEALARCQRAREEEEQKKNSILEETASRRAYLRSTGHASIQSTPDVFAKAWKGPKCILKATRNGPVLILTGSYTQKKSALASMLFPSDRDPRDLDAFTVQYTGKLVGTAFIGKLLTSEVREKPGVASGLLAADDGTDFVAFLGPDHQTIEVLVGNDRHSLTAVRDAEEEPSEST